MSKFDIAKITRPLNKVGLQLKKHSPEILVGAGIVGTVTASVMACKATTKAGAIIEEHNNKLSQIHQVVEMNREDYTEQDMKKDTTITFVQTGVAFVKLYGPSILLGAVSIASILKGHNILKKRNIALASAYGVVNTQFKEYRDRVVERFGKELDKELRYNIKAQEVEEKVVDENTGEEKTIKKTVDIANPNMYSDYARFYDDGCTGWTKDPEANLLFLKKQQEWANEKLKAQGYLFLNDVYSMLGIPMSKAGQIVGWIYDEKHPVGDNYVDFGIYNTNVAKNRDFVNGYERTILLDFNVDGNILDMI